jgi:hypothetical protein
LAVVLAGSSLVSLAAACGSTPPGSSDPLGSISEPDSSGAVLANECSSGTSGWIELYNPGPSAADLDGNATSCFFVDDEDGGGSPKHVVDGIVSHATGSTTCAAAGRPAACALLAPGEHVWVPYAYVNSKTPDQCRMLTSARSGSTCSASYAVADPGGATESSAVGQCFGRVPSGGTWASTSIPCTPGAANPGGGDAGAEGGADASSGDAGHDAGTEGGADGGGSDAGSGGPAVITHTGTSGLLLQGMVVTATAAFPGEVLVQGNTITCVAASCSSAPGASTATVVATNGIILPGLIDTHNHILFDIFDETDWSPSKPYTNHNQWPNDPKYNELVNAKQWMNGETSGSPVSLGCEMDKYGEIKGLIAGTTSIVGAANPDNKACYGTLARTIDQSPNGLGHDAVQVATLFPSAATADSVCKNFSSGTTAAYVIHDGEGVDSSALAEFAKLTTIPTVDGCLDAPQTTIVHGAAFGDAEFTTMAASGMGLVWSPRSNVFLYGAGTDLTKTANVPLALSKGINVALAPDWSIGGSHNLLDELRFADQVDNGAWGNVLTPQQLFQMVTINAAKVLELDGVLGSLDVGKRADVVVLGGDTSKPYDALLASHPKDVRLVLVDGVALYGDAQLEPVAPQAPGCDALDVCTASKFLCVATTGGTATNKFAQTLGDIESSLSSSLASYDALDLTQWNFSPITPLFDCP